MANNENSDTKDTLFASDVLVHIGSQEIESVLPTASEYTRSLYDQIRDKEQKLEKAKNLTEKINNENDQREESVKAMKKERDILQNMLDDRKKQLTENNSNLTISHKKTVRMIKEYESVKHRIQQIQTRREDLRQQIAKQQEYFEDISRKLHERMMRRQSVDNKLSLAESSKQTLNESLKRDAKTIRELEVYLAKITKQIYERQREIDELKLGQLDRKAETEGIKRTIKEIENKQARIQNKYIKNMAVRDRIMNTYQNKKARPDESEIEVENLRRRLNQAEEQIRSNERRFQKAEEEGRFLERGYINTYNKLMEKHLKLAEINAENNVLHNRIERFRVLSQSLLSGDSIAMYKAYIRGVPDIGQIDEEDIANEGIESIIKKKEQRLLQMKLELTKAKDDVNSKRALLQSEKSSFSIDGIEQSESELNLKTSRSVPDMTLDPKAPKSQLARFDKQRKEILVAQEKHALTDLSHRKQKLIDEVAVLNTQTNNAINEYERLVKEIANGEKHAKELKTNLEQTVATFKQQEVDEFARLDKIQKEKDARMNDLYRELAEVEVKFYQEESKRNTLNEEIRQAEVDEDNLRNRYQTYKGLRQSQQSAIKQLENTQNTVEEWYQRVNQSKKDLDEMRQMLAVSVNRNRAPRQQLATLKPYFNEVSEQQALMERKKELEEQMLRLRRQQKASDAERSGEISFS